MLLCADDLVRLMSFAGNQHDIIGTAPLDGMFDRRPTVHEGDGVGAARFGNADEDFVDDRLRIFRPRIVGGDD